MKKILFVLLLLAIAAPAGYAQLRGVEGHTEIRIGRKPSAFKELTPLDLGFAAGYTFNRWISLSGTVDFNVTLFDKDDLQRHYWTTALGVEASSFVSLVDDFIIQLYAGAGNSLGGGQWKYTYIDAGLRWYSMPGSVFRNCYLGFGIKNYFSNTSFYSDQFVITGTLGIKWR